MLLEQAAIPPTEDGHSVSFPLGRGINTNAKIRNAGLVLPPGWGLTDGRYVAEGVEADLVVFHDKGMNCVMCTVSRQDRATGNYSTVGFVDFESMPDKGITLIRGFNSAVGDNNSMVYVRLV